MIKKILIGIAAVIVLFVIIVALQPGQYRVSRSATIPAAPAVVFEHVNDLHKWETWSPWAKMDPNAKTTFEGPATGVGAVMAWERRLPPGRRQDAGATRRLFTLLVVAAPAFWLFHPPFIHHVIVPFLKTINAL